MSTYNNQPLSLEDKQKTVQVSVIQQRSSPWTWMIGNVGEMASLSSNVSDATRLTLSPEEEITEVRQFPVPADGVIPLNILVMDETETLTIDVSKKLYIYIHI